MHPSAIPGMIQFTALLWLALITGGTCSIDFMRARFDAKMADLVALETRIAPATGDEGAEFPMDLVDLISADRYNPELIVAHADGQFTPEVLARGFRFARDMIGARYVSKLHDILLSSQDEILMKYSIRETLESEYDYTPRIEHVLDLVRKIVPRSTRGVVTVSERVDTLSESIKTKNIDQLVSEIAALFNGVSSNEGKAIIAATVRAACRRVSNGMDARMKRLAKLSQQIADARELKTMIQLEKERVIVKYKLGESFMN